MVDSVRAMALEILIVVIILELVWLWRILAPWVERITQ